MRPMVLMLLATGLGGIAWLGCHGTTCEELRACIPAKDGSVPDGELPKSAGDGDDGPAAKEPSADASDAKTSDGGSGEGRTGPSQSEQSGGAGGAGGGSAGTLGGHPEDAGGHVPSGIGIPNKPGTEEGGASPLDCGAPPKPSDGEVSAPLTTLGSSARYTCKEGYYRRGVQERKCQATGAWSDATPTCEFVDCRALPSPTNGAVQAARTTYGAEAKYSCPNGYDLTGSANRTCQADGTWSGTAPTCAPKDCGTLAAPTRGKVEAAGTSYGSVATYSCTGPSVLSGAATRTCQADGAWSGTAPVCQLPPKSCQGGQVGAGMSCGGANGTENCCASPLVEGGTYYRGNNTSYPATVSSFQLDKYEITVGRFRAFVAAGLGTQANAPASGSGANPNVPDSGWDPAWNTNLSATTDELTSSVQCDETHQTWTGNDDKRPMSCITWYEAFAFCIWDGGRLPTDLERNYAASGGSEQRPYPWGSASPDCTYANFSTAPPYCGPGGKDVAAAVGSYPAGSGKWDQADLAGNVAEWELDWNGPYPSECHDCAIVAGGAYRMMSGGSFTQPASDLRSSHGYNASTTFRNFSLGARCARNP